MLITVLGRIAQFLLMLSMLKISTYLLSPDEIGKMALLMSTIAFISLFLINPIGMYVNRHFHGWNNNGRVRQYLNYHWIYIFIISILSTTSLGLLSYLGLISTHLSIQFVTFFMFSTLFFNTINQTTIPSLNMLGYRESFTLLSIGTVFFGIVFAVVFTTCFGKIAEFWLLGLLAGQVLFAFVGSKFFFNRINPPDTNLEFKLSLKNIKSIFNFSWPIALAVGLTWFQSQSYRFFIEYSFGVHELGLFVAGYGISAGIIAAFEAVFATYFQPLFYKGLSNGQSESEIKAWNEYAAAIIPSLLLLFFVITTLAPILTGLILAKGYQDATRFLVWGALIESFRVIVNVYSMAAHAKKDTRLLILPNLIGAVVSIALIFLLTPYMGITGIGCALAIAGFSAATILHISIRSKLPIIMPNLHIVKAIGFGFLMWFSNYYLVLFFNNSHSIILSITQLFMTGVFAVIAEYYLLREVFFLNVSSIKDSGLNILSHSKEII